MIQDSGGTKRSPALFFGAIALAVVVTMGLWQLPGTTLAAACMGGIFTLAAVLWATEALPLFATSLLVIGLQVMVLANPGGWDFLESTPPQTTNWRDVLSASADPILLLFLGGFILARAAVNEGVDRAMSALLLRPFGGKPQGVLLGVMVVTALFSMWMSNTATTAMMMTLVVALFSQMPPGEPFRKTLTLAVPIAANIGGIGTPIASPPNAVAVGFLQKAGYSISFMEWMLVAVPLLIGLLIMAWGLLWWLHPPEAKGLQLTQSSRPLKRRGWFVVGVFALTVSLWLSVAWHGIPAPIVALLPAIAFTSTGLISRKDLNSLDWHILILISGGITLGAGMQQTGLDALVASWLSGNDGLWLLTLLLVTTMVTATFMSNTAAANLILPIGISAAMAAGPGAIPSPVQAALGIAMAASFAMALPVSTPPNAIAYAYGEFGNRDIARMGILISLVGAVLLIGGSRFILNFWGIG